MPLTKQRLAELFALRGEDIVRLPSGEVLPFKPAAKGYGIVSVDRTSITYHRLKFFLATGILPPIVDHKDRNKSNNALDNLRAASAQQSTRNRRAWGDLPRGVQMRPGRKRPYRARVTVNRKSVSLGYFATAEAASEAIEAYLKQLHGEFYKWP